MVMSGHQESLVAMEVLTSIPWGGITCSGHDIVGYLLIFLIKFHNIILVYIGRGSYKITSVFEHSLLIVQAFAINLYCPHIPPTKYILELVMFMFFVKYCSQESILYSYVQDIVLLMLAVCFCRSTLLTLGKQISIPCCFVSTSQCQW